MDATLLATIFSVVGGVVLAAMGYVFKLAKARSDKDRIDAVGDKLDAVAVEVHDLHEWHDVVDADGVRRWYNKASIERALLDTARNSSRTNELLTDLIKEVRKRNSTRPPV